MPIENYSLISNKSETIQSTYTQQPKLEKDKTPLPLESILKNCWSDTANNLPNNVLPEQLVNISAQFSKEQIPLCTLGIKIEYLLPPTLESFEEKHFDFTDLYIATPSLLDRLTNCFCCCFSKKN